MANFVLDFFYKKSLSNLIANNNKKNTFQVNGLDCATQLKYNIYFCMFLNTKTVKQNEQWEEKRRIKAVKIEVDEKKSIEQNRWTKRDRKG